MGWKRKPTLSTGQGNKTHIVLLFMLRMLSQVWTGWVDHVKESEVFPPHSSMDLVPFPVYWLHVFSGELLISFPGTFFLGDHINSHEINSCQPLNLYSVHAALQNFRAAHSAIRYLHVHGLKALQIPKVYGYTHYLNTQTSSSSVSNPGDWH